ncbi:response regulator [Candidatus Solincola tengchongensis]|uniref:response regulator transcription factor n=1 Tax=Candidatus Solincola tengchongensis TaxID=2900693 RepID=UPI00257D2E64|nr:response regulator [Candidatus Solincola tengchongensis]
MAAKILVIDDDPDIVDALFVLLEGEGYEVYSASDGEEGLARIRELNPDLIILDLLMPRLDGYGVCKTLQDPRWAKWKEIPIIVLTSVREEASQRRYELETGVRMDVDDYIEKPIDPDVVLDRVRKALARRSG